MSYMWGFLHCFAIFSGFWCTHLMRHLSTNFGIQVNIWNRSAVTKFGGIKTNLVRERAEILSQRADARPSTTRVCPVRSGPNFGNKCLIVIYSRIQKRKATWPSCDEYSGWQGHETETSRHSYTRRPAYSGLKNGVVVFTSSQHCVGEVWGQNEAWM